MDRDGVGYVSISVLLEDLLHESNGEQRNTSSSNEAALAEEQASSNPATEPLGASKRPVDRPGSSGTTDVKKTRTQSPSEPVGNEGMVLNIQVLSYTLYRLLICPLKLD